ncbi:NitT/TauT family transport system permease protein [Salana multivorans]|uniref:NitT/TauT family transport system permease protein n=1 Tax=Salana multivorans TaxID=120377 RepID=A0A3N2D1D7_9MICO|nr:ABC transporter permease [Salana multivorans]OJX94341.1 MAG: ABC transporter permease [Micrococcales bacterium 73-15]ROR93563.1 NitT/TauT family transport system permease protein [Salana multivorans]
MTRLTTAPPRAGARAGAPRRATRIATTLLPALVLAVALLLLWTWGSGRLGRTLLPSPGAVVAALRELAATGDLWPATLATAGVALWGIGIAVVVALPLAWIIVHSRAAAAAVEPYVAISQAIPAIAIAPLLALWFGYGNGTTALLAAVIVFFPVVIATTLGLRSLDPDVIGAARVDGAGTWQLLRHLEIPLAAPETLAGLRAGVALAMTGAIVGEFVLGGHGLGQLLVAQRDRTDTAGMFATLVVIGGVSAAGYFLVRLAEHRARRLTQA